MCNGVQRFKYVDRTARLKQKYHRSIQTITHPAGNNENKKNRERFDNWKWMFSHPPVFP